MLNDDQYMERTSDLVSKIRKLRESVEKEMNRFIRVADYDVRRVVGQKLNPVVDEAAPPSSASGRKKKFAKSAMAEASIESSPAPAESGDVGEVAP